MLRHQPRFATFKIDPGVELEVNQVYIGRDLLLKREIRIEFNHLSKRTSRTFGHQKADLVALLDQALSQIPNDAFSAAIGENRDG